MQYRQLFIKIVVLMTLSVPVSVFAQQSEGAKTAAKIELFNLPGLEPPPTPMHRLDTANFKPENFSFRIWDKKDLTDRLEIGVPVVPITCKPSWGMFMFRVNAKGQVDSTRYRGNLPPMTSNKILANICATEGNWIIKPGTKPNHVAWYAYPFFDIRGRFPKRDECSEADRELLDAVSSLSNIIFLLYYQLGRDYDRGTLLRPTTMDNSVRL